MENFDKDGMGFAYAYQYPGLNKVLQAAGRVIRTENDRGVIVLLDDRFLSKDYDGMFPREWEDAQVVNIENISQRLGEFWNK
jgi:Rad3-related DNA helicase